MKQITGFVFAVLIGIAIGAGMGNPSAQQPCASPSPTPVEPSYDATTDTLTLDSSALRMSGTGVWSSGSGVVVSGSITAKSSPAMECVDAEFEPAQDITAYELAKLLPFIDTQECMTECEWQELGITTRHLKRKPKEPNQ